MKKMITIPFLIFFTCSLSTSAQEYNEWVISKSELMSEGSIKTFYHKFDFEKVIQVINYTVSIKTENKIKEIRIQDTYLFTKKVIKMIKKTEAGQTILFDDITIRLKDGTTLKLKPVLVTLK
jgi:hypothetical protein